MPNENTANDIRIGIDPEWDKVMSETLGDDWPAVLVLEHGMGCHERTSLPHCGIVLTDILPYTSCWPRSRRGGAERVRWKI